MPLLNIRQTANSLARILIHHVPSSPVKECQNCALKNVT